MIWLAAPCPWAAWRDTFKFLAIFGQEKNLWLTAGSCFVKTFPFCSFYLNFNFLTAKIKIFCSQVCVWGRGIVSMKLQDMTAIHRISEDAWNITDNITKDPSSWPVLMATLHKGPTIHQSTFMASTSLNRWSFCRKLDRK